MWHLVQRSVFFVIFQTRPSVHISPGFLISHIFKNRSQWHTILMKNYFSSVVTRILQHVHPFSTSKKKDHGTVFYMVPYSTFHRHRLKGLKTGRTQRLGTPDSPLIPWSNTCKLMGLPLSHLRPTETSFIYKRYSGISQGKRLYVCCVC